MKAYEENGRMVTTPMFAGTAAAVALMQTCAHDWQTVDTDSERKLDFQRCTKCGATRAAFDKTDTCPCCLHKTEE